MNEWMIKLIVGSVGTGFSLAIVLMVCFGVLHAVQWLIDKTGEQASRLKIWLKQKRRKKRHENSQPRY